MTNGVTRYVMYGETHNISVGKGTVTANFAEPYFNCTTEHFSSHRHAQDRPGEHRPEEMLNGSVGYIGWNVFSDYGEKSSLNTKELVTDMIKKLIGDTKRLEIRGLPDRGLTFLNEQKRENRLVHHVLFAHTTVRGQGVEVIEDVVPLYNIDVKIRWNKK